MTVTAGTQYKKTENYCATLSQLQLCNYFKFVIFLNLWETPIWNIKNGPISHKTAEDDAHNLFLGMHYHFFEIKKVSIKYAHI